MKLIQIGTITFDLRKKCKISTERNGIVHGGDHWFALPAECVPNPSTCQTLALGIYKI